MKLILSLLNLPKKFLLIRLVKWRIPSNNYVHDNADGPHVGGVVVFFPFEDLGGDVAGGAALGFKAFCFGTFFRETEVGDLGERGGEMRRGLDIF